MLAKKFEHTHQFCNYVGSGGWHPLHAASCDYHRSALLCGIRAVTVNRRVPLIAHVTQNMHYLTVMELYRVLESIEIIHIFHFSVWNRIARLRNRQKNGIEGGEEGK